MRDEYSDDSSSSPEHGGTGLVLGLGHAGIQVLDQTVMRGAARTSEFEFMALDADQSSIDGSVLGDKRVLGMSILRGMGSFGDSIRARAVWKAEKESIVDRLASIDQLVIVAGLGGGFGTTFSVEVARSFRERARSGRLVVIAVLPFSFESEQRQAEAARALAELRTQADAVLAFSNDRAEVWPEARQNLRRGLHGMNLSLAHGVEAVTQILAAGGMNPLSFADLRGLFGRLEGDRNPENCWISRAEAQPEDDASALVERVLSNPLLSDSAAWQRADRCLACLVGGTDFSVSQLQAVSKALESRLPGHISISLGTRTVERFEGRLALSIVLAATAPVEAETAPTEDEEIQAPIEQVFLPIADAVPTPIRRPLRPSAPEPESEPEMETELELEMAIETAAVPEPVAPQPKPRRTMSVPVPAMRQEAAEPALYVLEAQVPRRRSKPVKQEELPFEAANSGRFENSFETIHKGENLDQPTFRRRRLTIQL